MQIPKSFLVICMAALGVSSVHAQRADSDVQAKAREALRQKIAEAPVQQHATNAVTASQKKSAAPAETPAQGVPKQPPTQTIVIMPAPATAVPAPVATVPGPEVPVSQLDPGTEAKAREVLRQKLQELRAQDIAVQPAPMKSQQAKAGAPEKTTQTAAAVKPAPKSNKTEFADPGSATATTVAAPAAGSKEAKLAELLKQYMADQITPNEYHAQRARIIAEP